MFAIIRTGGKQYKVSKDTHLKVEKLTAEKGSKIELDQILMVSSEGKTSIGEPLVSGAKVTAEIVDHIRDDKVIVFKKKRRANYRRTKGHRQDLTVIRITDIKAA
jgi:large subunit ribosomal protein L21